MKNHNVDHSQTALLMTSGFWQYIAQNILPLILDVVQSDVIIMSATSWEKMSLGFPSRFTQTRLYSHWRWLEAWNVGFRNERGRTMYVVKTKALFRWKVTAQLICAFVFAGFLMPGLILYLQVHLYILSLLYVFFKGEHPSSLTVLNQGVNGQKFSFDEFETCTTCGEPKAERKCSACKMVSAYCKWASLWENRSSGFPTRSDTNRAVQPQRMTWGLKFRI